MLHNQDTNPTCRRLLYSTNSFSLDHMPVTHRISNIPPLIQDALPLIAVTAANAMIHMVRNQNNVVYTYAFNRIMAQDMRNRDWQTYLEACVFHTWANVQSNTYNDDATAIEEACTAAFTALACDFAYNHQVFGHILNTQMQNEVEKQARLWVEFKEAYEELENTFIQAGGQNIARSTGGRVTARDVGFRAPGQGGADHAQQRTVPGSRVSRRGTAVVTDRPGQTSMRAPVMERSYAPQVRGHQQQQKNNQTFRRQRFVGIPDTAQAAPEPEEKPTTTFQGTMTEMVGGKVTNRKLGGQQGPKLTVADWLPSHSQPFHPAIIQGREIIYDRTMLASGSPAVIAINSESNSMDPSEHVLSASASMFRRVAVADAPADTVLPDQVLSEVGKAIVSGGVGENDKATELYRSLGVTAEQLNADAVTVYSVQEFIRAIRVERLKSVDGASRATRGYFANGTMVTSFVAKDSLLEPIKALGELDTFEAVAEMMSGYLTQDLKLDEIAVVMQLDMYLRNFVQSFIQLNMGQRNFTFDSFMADAKAIPAALETYGRVYRTYYEASQKALIQMVLSDLALEESEATIPVTVTNGDQTQETTKVIGHVLNIQRYCTGFMIDLTRESFGLDTPEGVPCEIFPDSFKGLYELIQAMFSSKKVNALETHYLILADNTVFEVACSSLVQASTGKPTYIIRRASM